MDLMTPLASIAPGLDSAALTVLAGADTAMSATQIQRIAGRGSRYGLVLVLERLAQHGLVTAIPAARGNLYQLNREHILAPVVIAATNARAEMEHKLGEALRVLSPKPLSAAIYGSVARGEATPDSDIDLLVITTDSVDPDDEIWTRQIDNLEQQARLWTGNLLQIVTVPRAQLVAMLGAGANIVTEWERDAQTIYGQDARRLICATQRNTPVSSEPLEDVVGQVPDDTALCDREEAAMDAGLLHVGPATWSRDEVHTR